MSRGAKIALGVPAALAVLLGIEVGAAMTAEYLVDVDYVVDEVVAPPAGTDDDARDVFRLWVLGDSTAAGVGATTEDQALPVQIAERVALGSGRTVHVTGLGVSGAQTRTVLTDQVPQLPTEGVDAVVVVVGSNNVTHVTLPWTIREQTRELVRGVHRRTGAPVVVGGIPRFAGVGALAQPLRGIVDRYAGILRTPQEQAVDSLDFATFVDISTLASPRFIGVPEAMSSDDFHPSGVGYGFWADALAPPVAVIARR